MFVHARREAVAASAAQDLRDASRDELPHVLHRLAGKLAVFGMADAGAEARQLLADLAHETSHPTSRVERLIGLLDPGEGS